MGINGIEKKKERKKEKKAIPMSDLKW